MNGVQRSGCFTSGVTSYMRVARRNGNVAQRLVFAGDVLGFRFV